MKYKYYILSTANDFYISEAVCRELEKAGESCYFNLRESDRSFNPNDCSVVIAVGNDEFISNTTLSSQLTAALASGVRVLLLQNEVIANYPHNWDRVIKVNAINGHNKEIMSTIRNSSIKSQVTKSAFAAANVNGDSEDYEDTFENLAYIVDMSDLLVNDDSTPVAIKRAIRYLTGDGVPMDTNRAYSIICKAYDEAPQNPYISYYYGLCKEFGLGTKESLDDAIRVYEKATDRGFEPARIRLALSQYMTGNNIELVKEHFKEMSKNGNLEGTFMLGRIAEDQGDYDVALELYSEAAECGYVKAQNAVGCMYASGKGVTQSNETAMQWFTIASQQNFTSAFYNMGVILIQQGNVAEGIEYMRSAAEMGHQASQQLVEEFNRGQAENQRKEQINVENRQRQMAGSQAAEEESAIDAFMRGLDLPGLFGYAKSRLNDGE